MQTSTACCGVCKARKKTILLFFFRPLGKSKKNKQPFFFDLGLTAILAGSEAFFEIKEKKGYNPFFSLILS